MTLLSVLENSINSLNIKFNGESVYLYTIQMPDEHNVKGKSKRVAMCLSPLGGSPPESVFRQDNKFHYRSFLLSARGDEKLSRNDLEVFLNGVAKQVIQYTDDTVYSVELSGDIDESDFDSQRRVIMYYILLVKTVDYLT